LKRYAEVQRSRRGRREKIFNAKITKNAKRSLGNRPVHLLLYL